MICKPKLQSAKPDAFVAAASEARFLRPDGFTGGRLFIQTAAQFPPQPPSHYAKIEAQRMKPKLGSARSDH